MLVKPVPLDPHMFMNIASYLSRNDWVITSTIRSSDPAHAIGAAIDATPRRYLDDLLCEDSLDMRSDPYTFSIAKALREKFSSIGVLIEHDHIHITTEIPGRIMTQ